MSTTRRTVLLGAGGSLLTVALAGCHHATASPPPPSTSSPGGAPGYPDGLALVAVGAAYDALLVQAYDLAAAGVVGPTPFTAYLTAARSHHAAHAAAWTRLLTAAGATAPAADALRTASAMLAGVRDAADLTTVTTRLLALERTAAATALAAAGAGSDRDVVALAASIAPVEAQHGGVLALLLGDPVAPAGQLTTAGALGPGSLT